jgi:ABC-2 type transport system ATP-binding protein
MINNGQDVLYGDLSEIKARYKGNSVLLDFEGKLGKVAGVTSERTHKGYTELMLDDETTPQQVLEHLISRGMVINRFEVATPSLNEIFLKEVGKKS